MSDTPSNDTNPKEGFDQTRHEIRKIAASAGVVVGAWAGSEIGAAAGTLVLPGVGTVAGYVLGGAVGAVVGIYSGSRGAGMAYDVVTDGNMGPRGVTSKNFNSQTNGAAEKSQQPRPVEPTVSTAQGLKVDP